MPKGKMDASWTLFDESTVRRLMVEQPGLMPNYPAAKALKRGIDLAYGKKQITSSVTSAILQGKSIKGIADDLQSRIPDMNRASAIRTARTSITGAQNGGRQDTYQSAVKMGIKMKKQWLATLDSRTRHSHAMLDGEIIDVDGKYSNGCRYPGDPHGKPHEIYNCSCSEIAVLDDVDTSDAQRRARDPETGESVLISDMSYQEWAGWKSTASVNASRKDTSDIRDNLQSIDTSAIIKTKSGFSAFPKNEKIAELSKTIPPEKGFYDVSMHGSARAVGIGTREANASPRLLASYIRSRKDYEGQPIRLLSCNTGLTDEDGYCFAKELSNALGVTVKAPNDLVFFTNGDFYIGFGKTGRLISYKPNQDNRIGPNVKKR